MKGKEDRFQDIESLLPRFCEGLTTEEESLLVEEWISLDDEHLRIVNRIHALLLASDAKDVKDKTDMDAMLSKVKGRSVRRKIGWLRVQKVAAILSVPLLAGCLWLSLGRKATVGLQARMIEVQTNPGMTMTLFLPDSTCVHLNSETRLRYPSRFDERNRLVELQGEAFFEVTHNADSRFVVGMGNGPRIEVFGTKFNVDCYPEDGNVSATLMEGSIGFVYTDAAGGTKRIDMKPYQKLVYDPSISKVRLYATNGEAETSWKDGRIVLDNTSMDEVLRMLGKRFNVKFIVKNDRIREYAFTGTFTSQRLDRILEFFKVSSNIRWRYVESGDVDETKQTVELY